MAVYLGNKRVTFNNILNNSGLQTIELHATSNKIYTPDPGYAFSQVEVEVETGTNTLLTLPAIRPDAIRIGTYTDDYLASSKDITIPSYNTTATNLIAASNLSPTMQLSLDEYDYFIAERTLTIPIYNTEATGKGREEYHFSSYLYELVNIPGDSYIALIDDNKKIADNNLQFHSKGIIRQLYWSSATAIAIYSSNTYGITQNVSSPNITAAGVLTIKSPVLYIRGNATYLSQTFYDAITDVRLQYVIDVYRAPKNNLNIDGWDGTNEVKKILKCINGDTNHKLI